jgi:nitric oxide reductase NorD protein
MTESSTVSALSIERSCAVTAVAFSDRRREGARLMSGDHARFGLNSARRVVYVPYPLPAPDWALRSLTCGVALQCSPSKDRIAQYPLHELSPRELGALTLVDFHPLLGELPLARPASRGLTAAVKRMFGRMPWTSPRTDSVRMMSIPVGGEGGVRNPNLPPPSRPEDEDIEIRPDQRAGIPYPEWNAWTESFLTDHVAVLERKHTSTGPPLVPVSADVRRWFEEHTHRAMKSGLEDGSDLDIDRYVNHYIDLATGEASEPQVFRDLLPNSRDVTTALLLDGSSSLGIHGGRIFQLELACADALSRAITLARERHAIFVFSGNTRHRVEVSCLKDFEDRHFVDPSSLGLVTGGYTRLGAPLRHLTSRFLAQPSERRLLIVIGDGLMSDEGYEGRYTWADVAHALEEADDAGVAVYYVGVGPTRVDPLPEVFGPWRSKRIKRVEELPRVLAHVHRELVAA